MKEEIKETECMDSVSAKFSGQDVDSDLKPEEIQKSLELSNCTFNYRIKK